MTNSVARLNLIAGANPGMRLLLIQLFLLLGIMSLHAAEPRQKSDKILDLKLAVQTAQSNDPWLVGNRHKEEALLSRSIAAGSLPDPKISLNLINIAADSFNFSQEAMTNAKIGVSQAFPAGDTLDIRKKQLEIKGSQMPFQRENRRGKIVVTVGQLWLNEYNARESIAIIKKNIPLFQQLVDIAAASYSTALGKTRQQDLVRAQLELTRLEDRLTILHQRQEMFQERLSEWLNGYFLDKYSGDASQTGHPQMANFEIARKLPDIKLLNAPLYLSPAPTGQEILFEKLSSHPAVKNLEQKIRASEAGIDLAQQKYKPAWGVNAGYGYRASDRFGIDRSDFFSVGVTFSVPLFTANRQDKEVSSAKSMASAVRTEKWQLLRKLMASFETAKAQLLRLNDRQKLYRDKLLPQMSEQAEASLTAYTNDDGDFAEVMRSRIAEMNAEIDALNIDVGRQKAILQLNYLFMTRADQIIG